MHKNNFHWPPRPPGRLGWKRQRDPQDPPPVCGIPHGMEQGHGGLFGVPWVSLGPMWSPFGVLFGSAWVPLGPFWVPLAAFGISAGPSRHSFRCVRFPLGSFVLPWSCFRAFGYLLASIWDFQGNLSVCVFLLFFFVSPSRSLYVFSLWLTFGVTLGPLCVPLGSLWRPVGSILSPLRYLWDFWQPLRA